MIDKVKIVKDLTDLNLDKSKFNMILERGERVDEDTGELYNVDYYGKFLYNGIFVQYSNITNILTIEGRLTNFNYIKNRVFNYDDYINPRMISSKHEITHWSFNGKIYETKENISCITNKGIDSFIDATNKKVNELLGIEKDTLDIRDFKVQNIEVCFNVWLDNGLVDEYIKLFNDIFIYKKDNRYINYVLEKDIYRGSSFYIKTKREYEENIKDNYVINFYNKLDQLNSLEIYRKSVITPIDYMLAEKLLRLEVQLYYRGLKKACEDNKIENRFENFIDLDLCKKLLIEYYERFIGDSNLDFYSYSKAQNKIKSNKLLSANDTSNLLNYIRERAQSNKLGSKNTQRKYNKMLEQLGVHPVFIKTKYGVDYLKSPIELLEQKLDHYKEMERLTENLIVDTYYDDEFKQEVRFLNLNENPKLIKELNEVFYSK